MIGNTSRDSTTAASKLWLLLAIATLPLLTMAAGDSRETDVRPSLLVDFNAIRYKILGRRRDAPAAAARSCLSAVTDSATPSFVCGTNYGPRCRRATRTT